MALYSENSVKTIIKDPTNFRSNFRCEFKLDGERVYTNNMRLCDVGITQAHGTSNTLAGVYSNIKRISLLDGKTTLDSVQEVNKWLAFNNLNLGNSAEKSVGRYVANHQQGYFQSEVGKRVDTDGGHVINTTNETTTFLGHLDLKDCLPLLGSLENLPTGIFENMRLIVEYETDIRNVSTDVRVPFTNVQPTLMCDVIENLDEINSMEKSMVGQSLLWGSIEHDVVSVPLASGQNANGTIAANTEQVVNQKVRGFDNKYITRLLVVKCHQDKTKNVNGNDVLDSGDLSSVAGFDEIFNVRLNGKAVLARKGNDKAPNQRLAMLVDAYGNRGSYYGSNIVQSDDIAARVGSGLEKQGRQDYFGVMLMNKVSDLQINYTRTIPVNNGSTLAALSVYPMNLHLFAECSKQIVIGQGSYNIAYA